MHSANRTRFGRTSSMVGVVLALVGITVLTANEANAQQGGIFLERPQQNGQNGQGRGGRFAGQGGGRFRMQRRSLTLATVPVTAMTPYFGLTEEQAAKITELQKASRPDMAAMGEQFRAAQSGGTPEQQRERMRELGRQVREQQQKAETEQERVAAEIGRVLTGEQRPQIASFLRDAELFRQAELPLELIKPLDLDGPQKRKLQNIAQENEEQRGEQMRAAFQKMREQQQQTERNADAGDNNNRPNIGALQETFKTAREALRVKVVAVLTPEQKTILEKWDKEHPNQGGFPGGRGADGGTAFFSIGRPGAGTPPAAPTPNNF